MLDMARPAWFDHRVTALSPDVMTLRTELHALRRAAVLMAERIAMEWSDKFNDDAKVVLEDYGLTPEQAEACIKAPNHG